MLDAIVVGLGAMGSATLFELAGRGATALGIERFATPHVHGSTHGESRIIRQAYFEGTKYVPLVQRAYQRWAEIERLSGQRLLVQTGGLFFGRATSDVVRGSIRSAEHFGLAHEVLSASQIRRRFPPIAAPDDFVGLYEPTAGVLPPERCVSALRALATARGARIVDETEVLAWDAAGDAIRVRTAAQTYEARALVLTPGAWMPGLLGGLDLHLTVRRLTMFWFEPACDGEAFQPERMPIYICESAEGPTFYGFPALGAAGEGVKVAFHDVSIPADPDAVDRTVAESEIERMRESLRRYLPALDGPLRRTATCLYTMTRDEHFALDRHPRARRVIVASCCSGHGFKFSSAIGEALACLALDEAPPIDVSAFGLAGR